MFRKYSMQDKLAILRQLEKRSISMAQMAEELGVSRSTLHRWIRESQADNIKLTTVSKPDLMQTVQTLRQENQKLRQEVTALRQIAALYMANLSDA